MPPGINPTFRIILLSKDQLGFYAKNFVCTTASLIVKKFFYSGEVCIQPMGSKPFKNSDYGIWEGTVTPSLFPTWGTKAIHWIYIIIPSTIFP